MGLEIVLPFELKNDGAAGFRLDLFPTLVIIYEALYPVCMPQIWEEAKES